MSKEDCKRYYDMCAGPGWPRSRGLCCMWRGNEEKCNEKDCEWFCEDDIERTHSFRLHCRVCKRSEVVVGVRGNPPAKYCCGYSMRVK